LNEIPISLLWGTLFLLIILSAFFSSSETALMTLNRYRLQHLVKRGHPGARRAKQLLDRPDRLIGLILLGNNFVNILASSLTTIIALRLYGEAGIAVAAGLLTLVILIFSEVAPKTLAALRPEQLAFPASWVFLGLMRVLYPVVWVVNSISNFLLRQLGLDASRSDLTPLSKEELRSTVVDSCVGIPERYKNMLVTILDLEAATVEDVMTPRNEINGIDIETETAQIIKTIKTCRHSQVPVYKGNIDRVIGMLQIQHVLPFINDPSFNVKTVNKHLTKPYSIPESTL